ncbi:hypothetical protein MHEL_54340 [Mycolicibacterium helvum]|uniref:Uncharacterized protein n=1 Tax=Mycolicibacterium helvum TaxID=1534349 RepID=A0A7I7TF65_9MYCO|nr:hypothetical protein MHEL_54340 [Mycolicibacterium helvum]
MEQRHSQALRCTAATAGTTVGACWPVRWVARVAGLTDMTPEAARPTAGPGAAGTSRPGVAVSAAGAVTSLAAEDRAVAAATPVAALAGRAGGDAAAPATESAAATGDPAAPPVPPSPPLPPVPVVLLPPIPPAPPAPPNPNIPPLPPSAP